ncbi:MAG: UDP-N-acetylglucosamine 2-epimerase (non-hydrolyzing) [Anaerolineae bacterium]|nr:UDP-N-acetylglucosamine 2-epimerase (non-hydrolyzing) [Anaerolineae bacterium]
MKIIHVVGTRPNYMKIAPIRDVMQRYPVDFIQVLVHTGQHYDFNMSDLFFQQLGLPHPDVHLGVGSGSHAQQTARIMQLFEPILVEHQPDWVFVVGDVNSTLACALVACKMGIKVAHVEAGLRSVDRTMPEEINRLLTDQLSDLLFTPSLDGNQNLLNEGIPAEKIHCVGNVMIDTLIHLLPTAEDQWASLREQLQINGDFILVTLHRPTNVDHPGRLLMLMEALRYLSHKTQVIFPVHPRTRQQLGDWKQTPEEDLRLIEPLGYLPFLALQRHARLVITDSGGMQEETTYLGVPCLTVRPNTERPITLTHGTNRLIKVEELREAAEDALQMSQPHQPSVPLPLWDGSAATRIVEIMRQFG